jgi:Uma2 family endonuclease
VIKVREELAPYGVSKKTAPHSVTVMQLLDAPFSPGDVLTREEFLRRWEEYPEIKFAELIGGVVYMPPPASAEHGNDDTLLITWAKTYAVKTPGCYCASNTTWYMLEDAPQPDCFLGIKQEFGGQSEIKDSFCHGAPELVMEVCRTSAAYDLHQKLNLYESAGVKEYVAMIVNERRIRWMKNSNTGFSDVPLPSDGIYKSAVFPGLWLNAKAVGAENGALVLKTLEKGLKSAEYKSFAKDLAKRGKGKRTK